MVVAYWLYLVYLMPLLLKGDENDKHPDALQ